MKTPTFKEQYDKIVTAYLKDELRPMNPCACFVGNLLNNNHYWLDELSKIGNFYSIQEVRKLERCFMDWDNLNYHSLSDIYPNYEQRLYNAMERTLIMLRELHESKGEIIEDYQFNKRELVINNA